MKTRIFFAAAALFLAAPVLPAGGMSSVAEAQTIAYAVQGTTNLRAGPGTNYAVIGKVYGGTQLYVLDSESGWYYVSVNGQEGWMAGSRLEFAQARVVPSPGYYYPRPHFYGGPSFSFSFGDFDRDRRHRRDRDWRWRRDRDSGISVETECLAPEGFCPDERPRP